MQSQSLGLAAALLGHVQLAVVGSAIVGSLLERDSTPRFSWWTPMIGTRRRLASFFTRREISPIASSWRSAFGGFMSPR
jgi:hypothetical protein